MHALWILFCVATWIVAVAVVLMLCRAAQLGDEMAAKARTATSGGHAGNARQRRKARRAKKLAAA